MNVPVAESLRMLEPSLGRSVLCVGCDARRQAVITQALHDWDVVFTANASEGLQRLGARVFHAYIVDYWLPDWAGPALCREIKKEDPYAPVIFCTTAHRDQERSKALRAGASAYLIEPVDPTLLRARLNALVAVAEIASLAAKAAMERAIRDELRRRYVDPVEPLGEHARKLVAASIERTARAKAYKAFIDARGTRAYFEAWWPQVFGSERANGDGK